jgi:hypothetical protein
MAHGGAPDGDRHPVVCRDGRAHAGGVCRAVQAALPCDHGTALARMQALVASSAVAHESSQQQAKSVGARARLRKARRLAHLTLGGRAQGKEVSLMDCIAQYTRQETLGKDDAWCVPSPIPPAGTREAEGRSSRLRACAAGSVPSASSRSRRRRSWTSSGARRSSSSSSSASRKWAATTGACDEAGLRLALSPARREKLGTFVDFPLSDLDLTHLMGHRPPGTPPRAAAPSHT